MDLPHKQDVKDRVLGFQEYYFDNVKFKTNLDTPVVAV
jgi:hypothetical protein